MGAADGVGAGEHDEVVDAEALGPEAADELGEVEALKDGGGRKASTSFSSDTRPSRRPPGSL